MKKYYLALIILSLIALWPFFKKGYFETHDGKWMIIRFTAFHQTLASGQFPVRFVDRLNNNYGYPVMNFLYPLPFYISEIPKLLGLNFVDSIKITFILSTVFSSLAMFWALSQFFSRHASFAGAITYLFIPYRFMDLYVRGSLGENIAFAIVPLVLGSIYKVANNQRIFLPILAISTALLIVSHNVIAALLLPLFFLISPLLIKNEKLKTAIAFLSGFLISAFFWVPALYNLQFVKLSQIEISNIADHVTSVGKLIVPRWGYGPTPEGIGGFSPQIGVAAMAIFFATCFLALKSKRKDKIIVSLIIIFVTVFLSMTKYSLPLWQNVPLIDVIQFPWRLLSIIVVISALFAAFVVDAIKNKILISSLIIIASFISTMVYTKPSNFIEREEGYYTTNEDTTTVKGEYLPVWVWEKPQARANQKIEVGQDATIVSSKINATNYQAVIKAPDQTTVRVNTIFFPGWKAFVDGNDVDITYQDNDYGLMSFKLPKGEHKVIIKYGKTPVHLASEIISLVALIATGYYFVILWRKQNS